MNLAVCKVPSLSSICRHLLDNILVVSASNNNDTVFRREDLTASESLSNSTAHATSHSVTCSTSSAADATANCASCRTLNDRINKLQKQLATKTRLFAALRDRHKATLRKVRKMSREKFAFGFAVKKFLNIDQLKLMCRGSQRGSKWSSPTVRNALQLHFACGPTGYRVLLSQKYPLPSLRTLRRSIQFVKFETGIRTEVFQFLAIKVHDMSVHERECCLTLDEMSIAAGVEFDTRSGHFIGDVTLPDHTGVATHSLVFMLGGITTRWKQTVAYYYTANSTDGSVFAPSLL